MTYVSGTTFYAYRDASEVTTKGGSYMNPSKGAPSEVSTSFAIMVGATLRFWASVVRTVAQKVGRDGR